MTGPVPSTQGRPSIRDDHRLYAALKRGALAGFRLLYRVQVSGVERIPAAGPVVLVANHPSFLDPPILFLALPREARFLAWDRLFRHPRLAALLGRLGAIPLDLERGAPSSIRKARRVLDEGDLLGVFPEGRRTRGPTVDEFKRGAFALARQAGAPVVPVTILGARRIWGFGRRWPRLAGRIRIVVHPAVEVVDEVDGALLERVRRIVELPLLEGL